MLEAQVINQPLPKTAVVWNPTEVVMDLETSETGDAEECVSILQTAAEVMEETKNISTQESLISEGDTAMRPLLTRSPFRQMS